MSELQVFQDMVVTGPEQQRAALGAALAEAAVGPWRYDHEGSQKAERNALGDKGILIFERSEDERVPAARLVLWPQAGGYYVPNVTPVKIGQLSIAQYNAALSDFADSIARPVARGFGFAVTVTSATQGLEDWLDTDAVQALRRFSACANKSTGASHPMDERRWFDFIIAVHRSGKDLGADRLGRWLHEVEGWDAESAHDLAGEYERGLALLSRDAETR